MARVTGMKLKGVVGTLAFFERDGETFVRARPVYQKGKATPLQELSRLFFSLSSKYGIQVARRLAKHLGITLNLTDISNTRKWIRAQLKARYLDEEWLPAVLNRGACRLGSGLDVYQFILKDFSASVSADRKFKMSIPPLDPKVDILFPAGSCKIIVTVSLLTVSGISGNKRFDYKMKQLEIRSDRGPIPETIIEDDIKPSQEGMLFIALSLRYVQFFNGQERLVDDPEWMPVNIVGMGRVG